MKADNTVKIAKGAIVLGDVTIGEKSSIWYNAVVRGDSGKITIGKCSNIQDNCVVHLDPGHDVEIGDYVTVGHGAVIHGCRIGNNCLIGMGAIILNGAVIEDNCIIGAGALVTQNKVIPKGSLVLGNPGKAVRELSEEEQGSIAENALHYVEHAKMIEAEQISNELGLSVSVEEMTKSEFDEMIGTGLAEAKEGKSIPMDEVFDELMKGL